MPLWVRVLAAQVWDCLPSCETCVSQRDGMWLHMELWTKIYPPQREHGIANRSWIAPAVMPLNWCSFWRETEVDSRAVAAPGKDCSTTMHSCLAKCGSLLPRGQWTEHGCRCSQSATFPSWPGSPQVSRWLSQSLLWETLCVWVEWYQQFLRGLEEGARVKHSQ